MPLIIEPESISVLVLDDDPADAALIERSLGRIPDVKIRVEHAATLVQALACLETEVPDVVLADYRLGPITGIDALQRIHQHGHSVPVILMTGQGCEETAAGAFRAGAADYVIKSAITPEGMERAIRNAREKHNLREMIRMRNRELEQKNRELERKGEQIASFYHTLSHELKTPLTSTREFVSIVADGLAGPTTPEQQEYLRIAKDGCDLLNVYINDMLDVTRIETGRMSLEKSRQDLGEILATAVEAMRPLAEQKQIALELAHTIDGAAVHCDPTRIRQVLVNLLNNAIKFTAAGGSIEVNAARSSNPPDAVTVSVRDTGRGIPPEHHHDIFEHLYQVRGDDTSSQEGLGLGLALCKQLIEAHDGQIGVHSSPGVGSTFFFTLNLLPAMEPAHHG